MGNFCNRNNDSSNDPTWATWSLGISQDRAKQTFQRMGCLYCLAFFVFGKFFCLALLFVLPIAMIGMGAYHLKDCPCSSIIPVFLIVLGCYGALETIVYILRSCVISERCRVGFIMWEFTKVIMFGYFSWGSIRIYHIYEPNYERGQARYCDKSLYLFAFSVVTIIWILLALMVLMCLLMIVVMGCSKEERNIDEPNSSLPRRWRRTN